MDSVEQRIKEIVKERLGVQEDQIKPESSFIEDLSADSLDIVELILEFEDAFDIKIPDDVVESITTVGQATDYIKEKIASKDKDAEQ